MSNWKEVEEIFIMRITSTHVTSQAFGVFEWQGTTASLRQCLVRGPLYTMPKPEPKS